VQDDGSASFASINERTWFDLRHTRDTVLPVKALVVSNRGDSDPGFVGDRLVQLDFALVHVDREYPAEWPSLAGVDLLVHMGSDWSVYWNDIARNVEAESALMNDAQRRGVPIFGICFGAQMLAHSLGGSVQRAKRPEVGWCEVLAPAAYAPLAGTWMQWHADSFSAPASAEVLALSDVGPQAIRSGRSFGTQFHPEANEAIVTRWMSGDGAVELARLGIAPHDLAEATRRETARSGAAAGVLVDWFLAEVASTPMPKTARRA
jgi:GMP synthase-like glutamine amidotransferase